ncbi:TIGR04282 family arsenosugar biosynthesis glycosyltransferase [uncultured Nonlabens sp.]|uniref:TIGR04282 family arsenosugar biosynthesis glycosyltransferase n=1 Tax=uncultured Nonlabens sp. TaxID=859306 RepID=UPI00262D20B1|nr:TIGR04282 family arsenosugar biosynthesis glycosyltransferase [uncultured Nonlabens sp.]
MNTNNSDCLIIFTRNPELGKGKRRLAATVGDQVAFDIYKFLLAHTRGITVDLNATKQVWYSERVHENDAWDNKVYDKFVQNGEDLGMRMENAFYEAFKNHDHVIIIGSDMHDMSQADLDHAFKQLRSNDAVIGPAEDGGYYLLGFTKKLIDGVFKDKEWGTETVLEKTLINLKDVNYAKLEVRNDVDYYEDIKDIPAFQPFLKNI